MTNKYVEHSQADRSRIYKRVRGTAKMCVCKRAYDTAEVAEQFQKQHPSASGVEMRAYNCPNCHRFHLTKVKKS